MARPGPPATHSDENQNNPASPHLTISRDQTASGTSTADNLHALRRSGPENAHLFETSSGDPITINMDMWRILAGESDLSYASEHAEPEMPRYLRDGPVPASSESRGARNDFVRNSGVLFRKDEQSTPSARNPPSMRRQVHSPRQRQLQPGKHGMDSSTLPPHLFPDYPDTSSERPSKVARTEVAPLAPTGLNSEASVGAAAEPGEVSPMVTTRSHEHGTRGPQETWSHDVDFHVRLEAARNSDLQQLRTTIESLRNENAQLKQPQQQRELREVSRFKIFHCFENGIYLGQPLWQVSGDSLVLQASHPVIDHEAYLRYHQSLLFVVYKLYSPSHGHAAAKESLLRGASEVLSNPEPISEAIRLVSDEMAQAVKAFFKSQSLDFHPETYMHAPYLWWYHFGHRDNASAAASGHRPQRPNDIMSNLTAWIDSNYGPLYDMVQAQFAAGVVSFNSIRYLIRPGDVLVYVKDNFVQAGLSDSWLQPDSTTLVPTGQIQKRPLPSDGESDDSTSGGELETSQLPRRRDETERVTSLGLFFPNAPPNVAPEGGNEKGQTFKTDVWVYKYDGRFRKEKEALSIKLRINAADEEVKIVDLDVVPLRFVKDEIRLKLKRRGQIFWSCRQRRLVAYDTSSATSSKYAPGQRFMIDYETYQTLHPHKSLSYSTTRPAVLETEEQPSELEMYLFPPQIAGFDLRKKKWVDLEVDLIRDVAWNKQAFSHLVIDNETKELIQALVTNQVEAERGTDLIQNKGNGLIMLLHGSPGTGKTFTAESVAEMAEKPLYPVTCGDIGTNPTEVEKYLESVFHLGNIWGCVVLLDEADVFLEQRSLNDLTRNALVSVFLRTLEYYDGILILTSNRVGIFDEAFKSRIQLALRYEKLDKNQRIKIWGNFLERLKKFNDQAINFDDIEGYIDELSEFKMNGRQIRNSITNARQLAQFKGERMKFAHLKRVIKVAGKFDTYLEELKDGVSDEEIARGDGLR